MKKSPIERLEQAIENEAYVLAIEHERHPEKHNTMWFLGYYQALQAMLDKIAEIRRGQL